ncbi:hypothetical protein [Kribbella sp. CA-293567]|uniref:hypothetical protein n=1 Tax=Kribbella sp. CA-293567 TaxID=3002436 RepID=UPI0022DE8744|nr:hypothetical protein [Kribbella sp. CA-293567]WBQ03592.1 hypothetical protein OX958_26910 [Kribbella sp. CA-293567]
MPKSVTCRPAALHLFATTKLTAAGTYRSLILLQGAATGGGLLLQSRHPLIRHACDMHPPHRLGTSAAAALSQMWPDGGGPDHVELDALFRSVGIDPSTITGSRAGRIVAALSVAPDPVAVRIIEQLLARLRDERAFDAEGYFNRQRVSRLQEALRRAGVLLDDRGCAQWSSSPATAAPTQQPLDRGQVAAQQNPPHPGWLPPLLAIAIPVATTLPAIVQATAAIWAQVVASALLLVMAGVVGLTWFHWYRHPKTRIPSCLAAVGIYLLVIAVLIVGNLSARSADGAGGGKPGTTPSDTQWPPSKPGTVKTLKVGDLGQLLGAWHIAWDVNGRFEAIDHDTVDLWLLYPGRQTCSIRLDLNQWVVLSDTTDPTTPLWYKVTLTEWDIKAGEATFLTETGRGLRPRERC